MLDDFRCRRKLGALVALAFAAGVLGIAAQTQKRGSPPPPSPPPAAKPWQALEVCYTNHAWAVPLFVAAERGLFAHQGLQVKLKGLGFPVHVRFGGVPAPGEGGLQIAWSGNLPSSVNFEEVEVLASSGFDLAQRAGAASRLLFVHPVGITPAGDMIMALLVRNGAGIKTWQNFKGKKIGLYEPADTAVLQRVFRAQGLSAFSGKTDDIPSAVLWRGAEHFASGQIDALYTWGSIARRMMDERPGAYSVFARNLDCEPGGRPWYEACTYINRETLARKPEAIRRYVAAIDEAIDFIRAFPDQTRAIVPKQYPLDPNVAKRMELYDFLKSTEQLDFGALNQDRPTSQTQVLNVDRGAASVSAGRSSKKESASITPEIYYPHWAGAEKKVLKK